MESAIVKAIELVLKYTIFPIAHQFKYVCCYKSCVVEMKDAIVRLEDEKQIVEVEKSAAKNGGKLIYKKADSWLDDVSLSQGEVGSLVTYQEGEAKKSGCTIGGQILNPIARHKLGRRATKKKLAIEGLCQTRPQPHEISYDPPPPGIIVNHEATASAAAGQQTDDGIFRTFEWEHTMEKIMTSLKDDRVNVIGLHGMGGVGKSTMINQVYDQIKMQGMFDEVVRVEVKVKPEITRIQGDIAFQLGLKFDNECSSNVRRDRLRDRLLRTKDGKNDTEQKKKDEKNDTEQKKKDEKNDTEQTKKKTVLIILDDLWKKLDLEYEVGIPLGGTNHVQIKLLLTSREANILSDKMGARELIPLKVLSDADALRMFKFVVGGGAEGVKDDIVNEIAGKCSGLPIVIGATAKALKDRALDEWAEILERLDNDDVLEKLKVSYDYLPSKESKDLFLICGISRGPSIQVRDLLKYTFGLRSYNRKDSSTLLAAADALKTLLSRLEAATMLLKSDDHRYVKIHDRMQELAVRIVKEERPEWAYDVTLSDNCCELPDASELKLLLSCCEGDAVELQDSFLKEMKKLCVLEFTNYRGALSLSPPIVLPNHLRNLATLCFNSCSLDDISIIGELKGLQILSFRGSDICKLPIELKGLIALKMLDLSDCKKLAQIVPTVLGSLTKLEELNMENSFKDWEIDQGGDDAPSTNARLSELKNMTRLSNLRIHIPRTSMLPKDGQLFSSKLTMYQIMFGNSKDSDLYHKFTDQYKKFSRVLMLKFDSLEIVWQDWVQTTLQTAEVLYLSGLLDEKCKSMGEMCIKGFDCSNEVDKLCGGSPRLEEAFSKLRVVKVEGCSKLTHLFDFSVLKSRLSSQLEEISVKSCPEMQCIVVDDGDNNFDVVRLSHLQKLEFESLPKFSSFCTGPSLNDSNAVFTGPSSNDSNVLFTGTKVSFPCLESLIISGLDELENIWHPTDPPAELGNLRLLYVSECKKLVRVINSNVLMRLQRDLESLRIYRCDLMKEVFAVDDGITSSTDEHHLVLFSRLKELQLTYMDGLEGVHNIKIGGRSSVLTTTIFPNIKWLYVNKCAHLRYVLSCSLPTTAGGGGGGGGGYEHLKKILIQYCGGMESIIVVVMTGMVDQEIQPADATRHDAHAHHHHQNYYDAVSYSSYSSLKEVKIRDCPKLRTFCQYSCSQQDSVADQDLPPFFSQKEIFPRLESVDFNGLSDELGEIWPQEVPPQTSFNMLEEVIIMWCPKLSTVFPSTLIPRLENLTGISVYSCGEMRQIIMDVGSNSIRTVEEAGRMARTEMMFTFPRLTTLYLYNLPKLERWFYSSSSSSSASTSACGFRFPCLESLNVRGCGGVKTLFSGQRQLRPTADLVDGVDHDSDIAGALFTSCDTLAVCIPNLKSTELDDLTKIWKGEKPEGLILKLQSFTFSCCSSSFTELQSLIPVDVAATYLRELTVGYSSGLEYVFSPVGAASLVHLTHLTIQSCDNIKAVIVGDIEEDEVAAAASNEENQGGIMGDVEEEGAAAITFRHLKVLKLEGLRRLEKFSSVKNMILNFPSLQDLVIECCPKMTTFSNGIATASTPKFGGDLNSFVQKNQQSIHKEQWWLF